jgi:hypothetical protein
MKRILLLALVALFAVSASAETRDIQPTMLDMQHGDNVLFDPAFLANINSDEKCYPVMLRTNSNVATCLASNTTWVTAKDIVITKVMIRLYDVTTNAGDGVCELNIRGIDVSDDSWGDTYWTGAFDADSATATQGDIYLLSGDGPSVTIPAGTALAFEFDGVGTEDCNDTVTVNDPTVTMTILGEVQN